MHVPVMYDIPVLLRGKVFEVVLGFRGAVRGAEEIGDFRRVAGGSRPPPGVCGLHDHCRLPRDSILPALV